MSSNSEGYCVQTLKTRKAHSFCVSLSIRFMKWTDGQNSLEGQQFRCQFVKRILAHLENMPPDGRLQFISRWHLSRKPRLQLIQINAPGPCL